MMIRSVVIAEAGPLIALARIGQLDLLRGVFGAVSLTPVVAAEIGIDARGAASKAGGEAIRQTLAAGWLTIADLGAEERYPPAVLVLAKERNLIPTCGPLLVAMRDEGYFLSDGLVAAVINQAGES